MNNAIVLSDHPRELVSNGASPLLPADDAGSSTESANHSEENNVGQSISTCSANVDVL